jgi:photosystem II stability/assembly factor-like uncharacterized protein
MKKNYFTLALMFFVFMSWSQQYQEMIAQGTFSVQEIQDAAKIHFDEVGRGKGTGFKPFKRWEYQAEQDMDENGMLKSTDYYYNELNRYNELLNIKNAGQAKTTVGEWEEMGPFSWNQTASWSPGLGRVTSIAIDSGNSQHIIVGGETGGVYKTLNGGSNWDVLTDDLSNLNVYSLAMDPSDPSIYFWGSSNGVIFKSVDSGSTWSLLADIGNGRVNKIIIHPTDNNKMYCTADGGSGIWKSTNGGSSWTSVASGSAYDVEFKPGDPNIVYATGSGYYISTNGGDSFLNLSSSFDNGPKMIGVAKNATSAADRDIVYILEADGNRFGALYKSTGGGISFQKLNHDGKNYFNFDPAADGSATGGTGQAPRDMDITVNPLNPNDVHIAGGNTWRSNNGGVIFSITSQWIPANAQALGVGYCHADVDILEYVDGKLYVGTDGGLFVAENPAIVSTDYYTDLSTGIGVKQFYKIGVSQTNPVVVTGGSQDNGTAVMDVNGNWTDWIGADGMESFIDKDNSNIMYGTSQYGRLYKTDNGGTTLTSISQPEGKGGQNHWNWVTPVEQDLIEPNTMYAAYNGVYKSTNGGSTWSIISQLYGKEFADLEDGESVVRIDQMKIAPSNNNYIYTSIDDSFIVTINGGSSWFTSPNYSGGNINAIAVHPTDPTRVAVASADSDKVWVSTNFGLNWTSYRNDIPDFSARAIAWSDNKDNGLYVGMNFGVFYIDDLSANSWQPFSNGLPSVIMSELEINYVEDKIYAGTYGRGLWRSNTFGSSVLSTNDFGLNDIAMYPNAATTEVSLQWNRVDNVSVRVYTELGQLVYFTKDQNLSRPLTIDLSNLSSGLYFVKVNNINGSITKKLIVK